MIRPWVPTVSCLGLVVLGLAAQVAAEAPDDAPARDARVNPADVPSPLRFRRVYAPAQREEEWWPRGSARYVPVDAAEFDRLARAAQESITGDPDPARLSQAEYVAEYKDGDSLRGSLTWHVEQQPPTGTSSLLALAPLSIAVGDTRWREGEQLAEFGRTQQGRAALVVARSGVVTAIWSLRGRRETDGQLAFRLELPPCATSILRLTVPRGMVPVASGGLVTLEREQDDQQVYRILIGGQGSLSLRLPTPTAQAANQPPVLLRESAVYDISPRGLDLAVVWKLDVRSAPLERLQLSIDQGLELVSARLGEVEVPFTLAHDSEGGASHATLELADPLTGSDRPLRLAAIASIPTAELWQLPRIHAVDGIWQEGTCTLLVHEPLVVDRLITNQARQTKFSVLPEPKRGESFDLQLFDAAATIQLALTRRKSPIELAIVRSVEFDESAVQAELAAVIENGAARRSTITASVREDWTIDSVESSPPDALRSWDIQRNGPSPSLLLQLARRATAADPLTLRIRGHRLLPASESGDWQAGQLLMLDFHDTLTTDQLLSLRMAEPHALRVENAQGLQEVDPAELSPLLKGCVEQLGDARLYRVVGEQARFSAVVSQQPPRFAATISSVAFVSEGLAEKYTIQCEPEQDAVDQLLFEFRPAGSQSVRFRVAGEGDRALVARRLSAAEQAAQRLPPEAEHWRLTLTEARKAPFEILAERNSPRAAEMPVSLLSLPGAAIQAAQISVRAPAGLPLAIRSSAVTPVVVGAEAAATTRAVYDYPTQEASGQITLLVDKEILAPEASALVWQRWLESRYETSGRAIHRATFDVRNAGLASVQLTLPEEALEPRIWVDDKLQPAIEERQARVLLPAEHSSSTLVVEFRTEPASAGALDRVVAAMPDIDLPVMDTDWLLWLPRGYRLLGVRGGAAPAGPGGLTWSQRLLGPLGRAVDEHRWNLISATTVRSADPSATEAIDDVARRQKSSSGSHDHSSSTDSLIASDGVLVPYRIRASGPDPLVAQTMFLPTATALGAAISLLALGACLSLVRKTERLPRFAALAAALALIVPDFLAPMVTGGMWGILLAVFVQVFRHKTRSVAPPPSTHPGASSIRRMAVSAGTGVAILVIASAWACLAAQPAATEAHDEASDPIYRVFIPVDDQEQPTGGKYQVPKRFFDELERRAIDPGGVSSGFLIRSAHYSLSISREGASDTFLASDVSAQYEILVLRADAVLRLPTTAVRPGLVARREGRKVELEWDTDEDGFTCRFDEPGVYQLDLSLRPQRGEGPGGSLDVAIPAVPQATLEVRLPTAPPNVDVPSAAGAVSVSADGRKLTADLGPSERLSLRWARARQVRPTSAVGDADVWLWLQVQPASVILHARLEIKALRSSLGELWLSIDPRLRPLPVVDRTGTVASVQPSAGDPQMVRVELNRPIADHATIPVSFLLTGSSGIGQVTLPRIMLEGIREQKRTLAISVDGGLKYELPALDANSVLAPTEFLTHWGAAPAAPQSAVLLQGDEPFSLATRPRDSAISIKQRLEVSVGESRARVRFDAQIVPVDGQSPIAGQVLQYRLVAPEQLHIDKVTLVQDRLDRVARWARDGSGNVTVFLSTPTGGRQQLTLEGWLPVPEQGDLTVPRIDVDVPGRHDTTVLVLRQPDVRLTIAHQHGVVAVDRPRAVDDPVLPGRLALALLAQQDDYATSLRISANNPRVRSTQVTTITHDGTQWQGRFDYRAHVEDGYLDTITFQLPGVWTGPIEITPPVLQELVTSDNGERRLIIRPKSAIEGDYQLTIRGALTVQAPEEFTPPTLIPAPGEEETSFILLPTMMAGRQTVWTTTGMRNDVLPPDVVPPSAGGDFTSFRIEDSSASAQLQANKTAPGANGSNAQISVSLQPGSPVQGLARFLVREPRLSQCRLIVPAGVEVLEMRQAGSPITPERDGDGWRIALAKRPSGDTVEIAFRSSVPIVAGGPIAVEAPNLAGVTMARTEWCLYGATTIEARARTSDQMATPLLSQQPEESTEDILPTTPFGKTPTGRWSFAGNVPLLELSMAAEPASAVGWRWPAALALTILGLAWNACGRVIEPLTGRWPVTGLVAGLVLAAWISPIWLGMSVILASLLAAYGQSLWTAITRSTSATAHGASTAKA